MRCLPNRNMEPRPFKRRPAALAFFFLLLRVSLLLLSIGMPISDGDRGGGIISLTSTTSSSTKQKKYLKMLKSYKDLCCENIYMSPLALCCHRRVGRRRSSDQQRPGNFRCNRAHAPLGWPSVCDIRSSRFAALLPAFGFPGRPSGATRDSTIS